MGRHGVDIVLGGPGFGVVTVVATVVVTVWWW